MAKPLARYARLLQLFAFDVGWLACVWGAGQGMGWLGPAVAAVVVFFQALFLEETTPGQWSFVAVAAFIGFLVDSALIASGAYRPVQNVLPWPLAPPWILALWVMFTASFSLSLQWLRGRPFFGFLMGGFLAPLSYGAGERLGACTLHPTFLRSYAVLGIVWGMAVPALFGLYAVLVPTTKGPERKKDGVLPPDGPLRWNPEG